MKRFFATHLLLAAAIAAASARAETFELTTATVADINKAFDSGALTAEKLVELYLARIEAYDQKGPAIKAVLSINPDAVATARALDAERKEKGPRSPLHGIPIVAKDVFDTIEMPTTGGYAPLKGVVTDRDSTIVARLREAGAIILAKVNQSDWYSRPDDVAASSLGGNTKNPFALDRTPGWSSSGTSGALAARFSPVGLGSETGFSIRTPTSDGNLYGISTTSGLISRAGQMWSYITGERGGPMAMSVYDVCVTLDAIAGFDAEDLWTANSLGKMPLEPYVNFIDPKGLNGARVGVLSEIWDFTPADPQVIEMAKQAIQVFSDNGAQVFDRASLGLDLRDYLKSNPLPSRYERIAAIDQYLRRQGPDYPFEDARQLLMGHAGIKMRESDVAAIETPIDLDRDLGYRATLRGKEKLKEAVLALMDKYDLDALIYPHKLSGPLKLGNREDPEREYTANQMSPLIGFPAFIVPMGLTPDGLPVGLEILGRPWSEPTLIKLASGFEAATQNVHVPKTTPKLPGETIHY